jgi:hypothetical protein
MKYAALIFGDDERQPKAASGKLPSPEPGQIVRGIDGSVYRVASKIAGPDGYAVKLANLQGQPVQTPQNFRPVARAAAHFASWLKYHLAYNRDFDLYVNSYIEKYNEQHEEPLPYPVGHDGKAFRWADWFQRVVSPKLFVPGRGDAEDQQAIKDELIHEMLFTVLGHRDVLSQFASKAKRLKVNRQNAGAKLTDFLISTFMYRIDEMQNKLAEKMPTEEISMWQPQPGSPEGNEETNILETEEFGVGQEEFQSAEAKRDIAKFRQGFSKWLMQTQGQKAADSFILMFDIFWRILQTDEDADVKRSDLEQEWIKKTGLSFGSFKDYFTRLPDMIEQFITSHSDELGDKNIFVDLMNIIRAEREQRERKDRRHKERARPAMVSSLNTAGVETDFTEAISNTENPDVVDPDIHQPTESVSEAAKVGAEDEKLTCTKCHRTSNASDSNNLQCPHCGGNMKTATEPWVVDPADDLSEHAASCGQCEGAQSREQMCPVGQALVEAYQQWEAKKVSSVSKIAKLIRGDQLTPDMIKQVQDAFIYRWTTDNKRRGEVYHCDKCDVRNNPYVNTNSAEGHQHPTIPLQTDDEWLKEHAFSFTNAGRLQPRRHAQPAYLVPEEVNPILASVAHKFAMEKAAYNPGKGEYIYQSDVYCESCGETLKRRLDKKGYTPTDPSDESSWDSDKYPKGPYYNQESDGPEHCGACGEFLENPLTTEGYQYLNQMILEHEEDGKGQSNIIDEWKAFYPEREQEGYAAPSKVDDTLSQIEQDTDKDFLREMRTSGKKAMLGHDFNNAEGQAINDETLPDTGRMPHVYDSAELKPRVGAKKTAIDPSSVLNVTEPRKPTPLHKRPQDPIMPTHPLQTRESETGNWQCMDCGAVGPLDPKGGGCQTCDSQAVFPVSSTGVESPELVRETKPVEVEKRMIPRRTKPINAGDKTAQGSGGTTVTMQNQNVTNPNVPGKSEPMAVPEAIDQAPGPHSPNAPMTAPRTPGITPKIVNVPPGTEGEMSNQASARDPEEVVCSKCGGDNVDFDVDGDIVKTYCEDCEEVTHQGRLVPSSPVRDYRETPGDEWSTLERMGEIEGELDPEPDVDVMYEAERLDQFDKGAATDSTFPEFTEEDERRVDENVDRWLEEHGWVKENEHHGATWWMQRQMWYKKDHEESIPYQNTDDAVEKELELQETEEFPRTAAGSNSGNDDDRGAGDLWRENFYEHRTTGPSTNGLLTGMKDAAAAPAAPPPPNVQQQMNLVRPQMPAAGPGGSTVAIIPGEGQNQEEPGTLKRHTIEPELPNAKYHMMGALITAEEHRLMADAGLLVEQHPCNECGQVKPDVDFLEWDEFGDINDPTKPLQGYWCKDCALDLAQDI